MLTYVNACSLSLKWHLQAAGMADHVFCLGHAVYGLVFVEHLGMVLFFDLDVG